MRKTKNNTYGFARDIKRSELLSKLYPEAKGFKGVYDYKNIMIIYSIEGKKIHLSVSHKFKGEIYDDDLERIAKKFIKDKEYTIEKAKFKVGQLLGVIHIWEK